MHKESRPLRFINCNKYIFKMCRSIYELLNFCNLIHHPNFRHNTTKKKKISDKIRDIISSLITISDRFMTKKRLSLNLATKILWVVAN